MYPEPPSTSDARQAGLAFAAALPAIFLGFYVGSYAAGVGSPHAPGSILLRGLICAAPATFFALLTPRFWLLPSAIYAFYFYCGYTLLDGIGPAFALVFLAPVAALTGQRLETPPKPAHPELLWLLVIAIWFATFTSFLRRHYSHK